MTIELEMVYGIINQRFNNTHMCNVFPYFQTESGQALEAAWRVFGNQGNLWLEALLSVPKALATAGFQVEYGFIN